MADSRSEGVFPGKAGMLEKLEYKGFASTPMLDAESDSIHGAVDGYIDGCEVAGVRPESKTPAAP